jgi:hypothetical protein
MNKDSKLIFEAYVNNLADNTGPFTLYWINSESDDRAEKWYTANTLKDLLRQVNQDNLTGVFEYGMVNEDHEFMDVQELLDFCDNSDFLITDGKDKILAGTPPHYWDNGSEEDAEEKKESTFHGKLEFRPWAVGSKSESLQPFFIPKPNPPINKTTGEPAWSTEPVKLYVQDGTFNSSSLKEYDGKNVIIKGNLKHDVITVQHIEPSKE